VTLRAQPPVLSPLSGKAILAGFAGAAAGGKSARARVREQLSTRYHPAALILTDSGTSALTLAMRLAAARRPGQALLLPAWGCFDLATAALGADVPIALYDLDPATLGPDWDSLATAVRLEPAAVVGVHFYGMPIDWRQFEELLRPSGACLIEDAAQAVGAEVAGRAAGNLGDLSVLSFGRGKGMTGGRGGALLLHEKSYLSGVDTLRFARSRGSMGEAAALIAQWLLTRPSVYGIPAGLPFLGLGQTVFREPHAVEGISGFASGVLSRTLPLAGPETEIRRANAAFLIQRLGGTRLRPVVPLETAKPGWLRFPARLRAEEAQAVSQDSAARSLGIYPAYPGTLEELPGMADRMVKKYETFPGAREIVLRLLTLPTHSALKHADLRRIIAWAGGTL
jgi:perosamine synthetase